MLQAIFEEKVTKNLMLYDVGTRDHPFYCVFLKVTLTVYCACRQKWRGDWPAGIQTPRSGPLPTLSETLEPKAV